MILEIIRYPNPILRKKCKAVKKVDARTRKLIDDMIKTLHAAPGIGLAAPQIGESIRLIIVDIGEGAFAMVNPKIKERNRVLQTFDEGCLCLPGIVGPVSRPSGITAEGLDRNGEKFTIEAEGLLATVLQHEIDHLEGIIFLDRVTDKDQIRMVTKKEEEEKNELL